ncbi:hypothetical protein MUN76_15295 [Leucobacter rhizosphaerae]|uniref:Phage holin family protein n=1 Tax=Leucobacter rhizosphaerae TaxID=2932245 RepID=A0ABY4FW70_9MICO|nr:hypothetical protein [Leucobacter rhizosphaerae]UOQ60374.1 hypothetical protein MUN76_15295 [Leucobacter rhizosphaerae]
MKWKKAMGEAATPSSAVNNSDFLDSIVTRPSKVSDNTAQEVIIVTRDRVELALHRHLPRYVPAGKVLSSAALFLGLLVAVLSADFQMYLGISGEAWLGAFSIAMLLSLVLVAVDAAKWIRRPKLEDLVNAIESEVEVVVALPHGQ